MERNSLQYSVLTIGTIIFSIALYLIVQNEGGNKIFAISLDNYNYQTTERVNIYELPDKNSSILINLPPDTKVETKSETKFYFRIAKVDGLDTLHDGYILKRQLKKAK